MKKTMATLADGREIIYFDESDDACRALLDTRDLPDMSTSSKIRFDPLPREWAAIASHRQSRTHLPTNDDCPLCPSAQDRSTKVPSPPTTSSFSKTASPPSRAISPANWRASGIRSSHGRTVRITPCGAGVLLRKPRRGHRCDAAPPARANLHLPVCHPTHPARTRLCAPLPRTHLAQPVRRCTRRRTT